MKMRKVRPLFTLKLEKFLVLKWCYFLNWSTFSWCNCHLKNSDFEAVEPLGDASKDPCCIIKNAHLYSFYWPWALGRIFLNWPALVPIHWLHTTAVGKCLKDTPTHWSHTPEVGKWLRVIPTGWRHTPVLGKLQMDDPKKTCQNYKANCTPRPGARLRGLQPTLGFLGTISGPVLLWYIHYGIV